MKSLWAVCLAFTFSVCLAQNSPSVAPAATDAASATSPEVAQFQKIENTWADALNQRDQYGLELVLSPMFVDIAASGEITTRNQQMVQLLTGEDKSQHLEQKVITVRLLGDIAVANGTYALTRKMNNSAQVTEKGVFTHVFERQRGNWVCINSQRTLLREDSNAKTKKPSNAEFPFHFPLFSK